MPTDVDLIGRCADGDPAAARELIERFEPTLRGFLARLLENADDVEDALCDTFVRLWRSAPRFRRGCSVSTWLHRLAVSAATDLLRQRRTRRRLFVPLDEECPHAAPASQGPEATLLAGEREAGYRTMAAEALARLSPEERVAVTLYYLEDYSYQQVAQVTGVPVTTVRMRLYHARRRMRRTLENYLRDDEISYPAEGPAGPGAFAPCCRRPGL